MPDSTAARVAVYIDFDNIVISRYDQTFRRGDWMRDNARSRRMDGGSDDPVAQRLQTARVDVGAILDYASSFGTIVVSRAYADWSAPANAGYQRQLVDRAVDLTQLFTVTAGMKNGADIRLSVDVIEDLFRLPDVTHVVVVAGDSDYIALAQRARRLGRHVVGIGVAGATSRALMAACDEFADYDDLLDAEVGDEEEDAVNAVDAVDAPSAVAEPARTRSRRARGGTAGPTAPADGADTAEAAGPDEGSDPGSTGTPPSRAGQRAATKLLMRALRLIRTQKPDDEWVSPGELKNQMIRMDPAFTEKPLGYRSFGDFIASRPSVVEIGRTDTNQPRVRLRQGF